MEIINIDINGLKPYEKNPRKNDNAVEYVEKSIREFGFKVPIIIDKNNEIVAGHTRYKAAEKIGLKTVPCIIADDLSDEQIKAFRLADNKVAEYSDWDFDLLNQELDGIFDIDMGDFGFGSMDFNSDGEKEIIEDEPPEIDENSETICKFGDIWQLGEHRLMCGDSTDREQVERLMNGEKADMVFTDSPYGINIVNDKGKVGADNIAKCGNYNPVIGDDTTETARSNYEIIKGFSANQIIFGGNYFTDFLPPKSCWIVWDKENTGKFADCELAWTSFDKAARLYKWLWNGLCRKGERKVEGIKRVHPTQKPVGLIADILNDFTESKETILDCFGGSGSTLIACEQLDRKCYMMELSEKYCDVIIKRWEDFTGKKAKKWSNN